MKENHRGTETQRRKMGNWKLEVKNLVFYLTFLILLCVSVPLWLICLLDSKELYAII